MAGREYNKESKGIDSVVIGLKKKKEESEEEDSHFKPPRKKKVARSKNDKGREQKAKKRKGRRKERQDLVSDGEHAEWSSETNESGDGTDGESETPTESEDESDSGEESDKSEASEGKDRKSSRGGIAKAVLRSLRRTMQVGGNTVPPYLFGSQVTGRGVRMESHRRRMATQGLSEVGIGADG